MRSNLFKRNAIATALALSICAGNALAASDSTAPEVFEQNGQMLFDPAFKAAGYQLTIAGPGDFRRQMLFAGDEALSVSIKSLGQLLDGRYKYEITAVNGFAKRSDRDAPATVSANDRASSSGSFSIVDGKLLLADSKLPEPDPVKGDQDQLSLAKDVVHADDVIVDGSLCVGFDCVNGENFGFDTIRLKENNVRIKFDDTSSSGSFPSNDWQLTANDSANGGANKFSIDDITGGRTPFTIEASAPSHSLYVDDGGRLGLGTSTPSVELHVIDGDTPTLRLQQDGSSGFASQTWDVAGNETSFFVRDVSNGSTLPFRIFPNAPSGSLVIEGTTGDVGIGTITPTDAKLHIKDTDAAFAVNLFIEKNGTPRIRFDNSATASAGVWDFGLDANDSFLIRNITGASNVFTLDGAGNLTITGGLVTTGGGGNCTLADPCDGVFDLASYTIPSIEDHARQMWENGFLPAVGPTTADQPINMTVKMLRMLNELEKAHVYIDQLNQRINQLEAKISEKD